MATPSAPSLATPANAARPIQPTPEGERELLEEVVGGNFFGVIGRVASGPWNELVGDKELGPYTPDRVPPWVLDLMRDDPQLALGLTAVKAPFSSLNYRPQGGAPLVRSFVNKVLGPTSRLFASILDATMRTVDYGAITGELVWQVADVEVDPDGVGGAPPVLLRDRYTIAKLHDVHPSRVTLEIGEHEELLAAWVDQVTRLDGAKLFHAVGLKEFENHFGRAILKRAYRPWYWMRWLLAYLMRYMEAKAEPPMIGYAPPGRAFDKDKPLDSQSPRSKASVLAEAIARLKGGGFAGLPDVRDEKGNRLYSLEILQDSGRVDLFTTAIGLLQDLALRSLGVPDRAVTQGQTGAYAAAQVHETVLRQGLEEIRQKTVLPTLNEVTRHLVRVNFGEREEVPTWASSSLSREGAALTAAILTSAINRDATWRLADGRRIPLIDIMNAPEAYADLGLSMRSILEAAGPTPVGATPAAPAPGPVAGPS